jgi:RND family efflux transporter MFP subunit
LAAPAGGTVTDVLANAGQSVSAGTPVVSLADLSSVTVQALVHETYIDQVDPGQSVRVVLDAQPQRVLQGEVRDIAPLSTGSGALVTYRVDIAIDSDENTVRPGMTGDLEIEIDHKDSTLVVPRGALRREDGEWVVQLRRGQRLVETPVMTGARLCHVVEVVSGLSEGDWVLLHSVPLGARAESLAANAAGKVPGLAAARGR